MSKTNFVDDERFDGLYLNVAENARGIEPLLDTVFSFLRRKTDFFSGPPNSQDGTAAAVAKVNQVLDKHVKLYREEQDRKAAAAAAKRKKKEETEAKKKAEAEKVNPMQLAAAAARKAAEDAKKPKSKEEEVIEMGTDGEFDIPEGSSSSPASPASKPQSSGPAARKEAAPAADAAKVEEKKEDGEDDTPGLGNGGTQPGKYVWTQTLAEVSVTVPLPDNTRGKDLSVTIARTSLKVGLKKNGANKEWIISDPLTKTIIVDDSFWTVEDGNRLVLNLQKSNQMEWWDSVCKGHKAIDVKKINPENSSLGDLDGETRKTVEKMMFDQRQKAMGLPSSDEQTKLDAIKSFQKAHPELDFSNAKINM